MNADPSASESLSRLRSAISEVSGEDEADQIIREVEHLCGVVSDSDSLVSGLLKGISMTREGLNG